MASSDLTITLRTRVWYSIACLDPAGYVAHFHCSLWMGDESQPTYLAVAPSAACPTFEEAQAQAEERLAAIRSRLND